MIFSRSRIAALVAAVALYLAPLAAFAQVPSNPAPYNVDLGALITNALRVPGTVTTSNQANTNWKGVTCTFAETVQSGSTTKAFSIEAYDTATNSYRSLGTATITAYAGPGAAPGTPFTLSIYPGIATSSLPTNVTGVSLHLPRWWRLSQTISGTGVTTATTSKIGCTYLL